MHHRQRKEIPGQNPCLSCGACCVGLRASFYWAEADDAVDGGVPARLTVRVDAFRRAMRQGRKGRCLALRGTPGRRVACRIYERRPSVCRNFQPAWAEALPAPGASRPGHALHFRHFITTLKIP